MLDFNLGTAMRLVSWLPLFVVRFFLSILRPAQKQQRPYCPRCQFAVNINGNLAFCTLTYIIVVEFLFRFVVDAVEVLAVGVTIVVVAALLEM